jgi:hypothetical protein
VTVRKGGVVPDRSESVGVSLTDAREVEVEAVMTLATRLLRERGLEAALRAGVDTMYETLRVPAAGRLTDAGAAPLLYERGMRGDTRWLERATVGGTGSFDAPGSGAITVADAGMIRFVVLDDGQPSVRALARVAMLVSAALDHPADDGGAVADAVLDPRMGLAWTAHEIRGPLAGVSAAIENVLSEDGLQGKSDLLRRSRQELERLAQLVDPLLRMSPATGHLDAHRADLVEVVDRIVTSPEFEKGRDRIVVASAGPVAVSVDEAQLTIAVTNLLRNAFAYAPAETAVVVTVAAKDGRALVSVLDGGPGIGADDRLHLFEPYARGSAHSSAHPGSGLGLFIARTVVDAHGGGISYEPWSGGSIFRIELPLEGGGGQASAS